MLKRLLGAGIACLFLFAMTSLSDAQHQDNHSGTTPSPEQKQFQESQPSRQQNPPDQISQPYASDPSGKPGQQTPDQAQSGTQQSSQHQQQQTQARSERKQSEIYPKAASMYVDGKEIMDSKVKDRNGREVGSVSNLILDRAGRVTYVIVTSGGFYGYGGKKVSVPAGAVTITRKDNHREIILNVDKDHLDSAPEYNKLANLDDALYVETVHRFFGMQPRWDDHSAQQGQPQPSQQPMQDQSQDQWKFQEQQTSQKQESK